MYDLYMLPQELSSVRERRRRVVCDAAGTTSELGVGTGLNFPLGAKTRYLVGMDPDLHMLRRARAQAGRARLPIRLVQGDGDTLPFRDAVFDTVISPWSSPRSLTRMRQLGRCAAA